MKRLILAVFVVFFLSVNAQSEEIKIGYVDFNKALNESENGKNATRVLEDFIKNKKNIYVEKEKEIKELDEELKKQASVLSPESRKNKEDQLSKMYIDYQRLARDIQEEIQKKESELTQEIQKDLVKIIVEIGKKEGYTVILERGVSGILYSQDKLDMTDRVIKKYNESSKTKK